MGQDKYSINFIGPMRVQLGLQALQLFVNVVTIKPHSLLFVFYRSRGPWSMLLATYNVHRFVGLDRRYSPERICHIIDSLNPDVMALQEFIVPKGIKQYEKFITFFQQLKRQWTFAPTLETQDYYFGNAVVTSGQIQSKQIYDLSFPGKEKRNLLKVEIAKGDKTLQVMATHLGLSSVERNFQFQQIFNLLERDFLKNKKPVPVTLLGDFNHWYYQTGFKAKVLSFFRSLNTQGTYPSFSPLLSLDQIWTNTTPGQREQGHYQVYKTLKSRLASDHLPLLVEVS